MQLSPKIKPSRLSFGYISPIPSKTTILIRSRGNMSTSNGKLLYSTETLSPKYLSPVNKTRHDLAFLIKDLNSNIPYISKAKISCQALDICASEEGIYQREMNVIVKSVKESIFQEKSQVPDEILNNIYELHTEVILDNKEIPYFFISESAIMLLEASKMREESKELEIKQLKNSFEQELKKKNEKIEKMQMKIQMDCEEPLKLRDKIIKELEEQVKNSANQILSLIKQLDNSEKECSKLKSQTALHRFKLAELEAEKDTIIVENEELKKNIEELYREIAESHAEKLKFKLGFEKSIIKLKQAGQREKNLENINEKIVKTNSELSIKAAEGFINLTPRPSFEGIEDLLPEIPKTTKEKVREVISLALLRNRVDGENRKRGAVFAPVRKNTIRLTNKPSMLNIND